MSTLSPLSFNSFPGYIEEMNPIKAFKMATIHPKIFWIVVLGVGIINAILCFYPYVWFDQNRSGKEYTTHD